MNRLLHFVEFELPAGARDRLEASLLPYIGCDKPTPAQAACIRQAVSGTFPKELFRALAATIAGDIVYPLLVRNVPEVAHSKDLEDKVDALGADASPPLTLAYWIALGLFEACGASITKSRMLLREASAAPVPRIFHRDIHPLTALSCAVNVGKEPTAFLDMREVLSQLSFAEKNALSLEAVWDLPQMTLAEHESLLRTSPRPHRRHGIVLSPPSDVIPLRSYTAAHGRFQSLVDELSLPVVLLPGSIVLWHNSVIYHKAPGGAEPCSNGDLKYTRVALFTGAALRQ